MLEGCDVEWTGSADTRDFRAVLRNTKMLRNVIKRHQPSHVVSTGSSLALSALPQSTLHNIAAHYIESVTRTEGFSMSGRLLRRTPRVKLYTQWPHLADDHWRYRGSVLDGFTTEQHDSAGVRKIVVSIGTSQTFGFRRLLEHLVSIVPDDVEVFWQTGSTSTAGLDIDAEPKVSAAVLTNKIAESDVLIAHAGSGISLTALQNGHYPILVPRHEELGEHVDDHQKQIARYLESRGLAMVREVEALTWSDIESAAGFRARSDDDVAPFVLG
jgi:UDP-N-acetylglucosamine--N-acetylmuramyl-(pentapeptide) pyrophosphoryl-undecaprenol N-acetylglucosamine transferase